ncbi:MucR family transcriptional regulator [Methylorubrum extorquens]|uniref:MucR family transcriptional regulator n=1 Tax=Methylorubrum extorquens TaxID=408 RepID=UPI000158F5AF|nr:MucR family transcriptional regulator [Methylorubrum extorquens]ABY28460.1 ROSMUCR transcriptional regulator [Methylorubrum extorquens PA1]KQP86548.1 MucR family transcriptional regulator [Methylobacterium sp. Leaf119]
MVTDDSCGLEAVTASIIIAYVRNNRLPGAILPDLIRTVHQTLLSLGTTTAPPAPDSARPTPAEVRKSITPDALISFIDGRPYKTLKRHLTSRGLDAYSYRARFGLPVLAAGRAGSGGRRGSSRLRAARRRADPALSRTYQMSIGR